MSVGKGAPSTSGSTPVLLRAMPGVVSEQEPIFDPALRAANVALSGRKRREVSRIASIELRFADARSGTWEALAMLSVGVATILGVVGVWFL